MKYMVMECQFSYAVVLDEDGNFLKVANRHYHVGQMVTDVIEMQTPDIQGQPVKKRKYKWLYSLAAAAACLVLVAAPLLRMGQMPYASVYMAINPEVRIDVNRKDVVVGLEGANADGDNLIGNYSYKRKPLNLVLDELVDRAIETGFLHEGGRITLVLDAEDGGWAEDKEVSIRTHLDEYLRGKMSVTIEVRDKVSQDAVSQKYEVVIPIVPANTGKGPDYMKEEQTDKEDHGKSDEGNGGQPASLPPVSSTRPDHQVPGDDGQSRYDDQKHDYNQSNYGSQNNDDGQSNYDSQSKDGSQSDYDD